MNIRCTRNVLASGVVLAGAVALFGSTSFPRSIVPVEQPSLVQAAQPPYAFGRIVRTTLTAGELAAGMDFDLALKLRNRDELDARIVRGEILSPAELEPYLPTAADYARIRGWLVAQGFTITLDASTRHAIFAQGSNAQVAAVFGVTLARVATPDGEFTSAITAPVLPDEIAGAVDGIRGLQPHLVRHPRSTRHAQQLEANSYYSITPAAVAAAYGAPSTFDGTGQTIAIIGASSMVTSDLTKFWSECGISSSLSSFTSVNVGNGPGSNTSDQGEIALDVEWAGGMAPGAQVRLYATSYPMSSNNEAAAYTQILNDLPSNPTIHQVTESYGGLEMPFDANQGDTALPLLAAQGVTCFAASGDGGSNPDTDPTKNSYNSADPLAVNYPASDPYMTAVGGTTLLFPRSLNGQASFPEVAWSVNATGSFGTGGGISSIFSRPSWQVATGMPAGNMRCIPDVSAVADTGSDTNDMGPIFFQGGKAYNGGGTSLSSPIWAGICAMVNQARSISQQGPVGYLNPKLYQAAASNSAYFTDITSGSNGAYIAGTGYDLCTGLGTPSIGNLIAYLTTPVVSVAPSITTQPSSQTITVGNSVTFTAGASGTPAPTLQWQKNNANINGATSSSFAIASVALGDAGTYTLVATNSAGSATSNGAVLAVTVPPAITASPANRTVSAGRQVVLTVTATGTPAPTYQWQIQQPGTGVWINLGDGGRFSGTASASLTITGETVSMNGTQFRCVVTNGAGSVVGTAMTLTVVAAQSDFNGDGHPDILWENTAGVDRAIWYLNGTGIAGFGYLAGVPNEWHIVGTADFNGDGQADILWEDTLTGDRSIWLMNGTSILNFAYLAYVDPAWHIAAIGDFNGDGQADLLWENAESGGVDRAVWFLNGTNISGFGYLAGIPAEWKIVGAADFNGDGQTDIVWEDTVTGDRSIWLMNGTSILSFADLGVVAPAWHIAMVADFNGDGQPDLLWENRTTGDRAIWLMNGTARASSVYLAYVDPVWHIAP